MNEFRIEPINPITGKPFKSKARRPFSTQTKKRVWMKAGNHNPENWRVGFVKTSYCMSPRCRKKLSWDKKYEFEFDHKNNDSSNNSEKNCFIVCNDCHKKHTQFGSRAEYNAVGMYIGKRRFKKKVGYKKVKRKISRKRKKYNNSNYFVNPITGKRTRLF
jgi:hypothetical protein